MADTPADTTDHPAPRFDLVLAMSRIRVLQEGRGCHPVDDIAHDGQLVFARVCDRAPERDRTTGSSCFPGASLFGRFKSLFGRFISLFSLLGNCSTD